MKLTTSIAVPLYEHIFAKIKYDELPIEAKRKVFRFKRRLNDITKSFREYQSDAINALKKENHDELIAPLQDENATEEQKKAATEYVQELDRQLTELTLDDLKEEHEFDDLNLSDEEVETFCLTNIAIIEPEENRLFNTTEDFADFLSGKTRERKEVNLEKIKK